MMLQFIVLFLLYQISESLKITKFVGPKWIESGSKKVQILDCPFKLQEKQEQVMEIKWFYLHKNIQVPIYQWIPGSKPQEIFFRGHIDTTYEASTDKMSKYRALAILKPTTELSGEYTCRVSSLLNEDYKQQNIIIYSQPKGFELNYWSVDNNTLHVQCDARDVFPKPEILLYKKKLFNNESKILNDLKLHIKRNPDTRNYRVSIHYRTLIDVLSEDGQPFGCSIKIPGTNFSDHRNILVYKDRIPTSNYGNSPGKNLWKIILLVFAAIRISIHATMIH